MVLVLCAECKALVSDAARACPRCGAPRPERRKRFLDVSVRPIFFLLLALSAGVAYASMRVFAQPKQIVNDSVRLQEGACVTYDMEGGATVHVEVTAAREPVDVVIAQRHPVDSDCKPLRDGSIGGDYNIPLLARRRVRTLATTARLPAGDYGLTVMLPRESMLLPDSTQVTIRVARDSIDEF